MKIARLIFCFACLLSSLVYAEGKELKVGVPLAFTGIASEQSENIRRGLELAREALEGQGWKIHLEYEDTTAAPSQVVSAVQLLLSRGYKLFVGPTWSYMVEAAKPVYERADVIVFSPATTSEVIGGPSRVIFHGAPRYSGEASSAGQWLKDLKVKRAAVIVSQTPWGNLHQGIFKETAKNNGTEIVYSEEYPLASEDLIVSNFAIKIAQVKPDALLIDLNKNGAALLLKKLHEQKISLPILAMHKAIEAVNLNLIPAIPYASNLYVFDLASDAKFRKSYQQRYGAPPDMYTDSSFDGLMLLAEAVKNTDGTAEQIRNYFFHLPPYQGAGGNYAFDRNGDVERTPWVVTKVVQH